VLAALQPAAWSFLYSEQDSQMGRSSSWKDKETFCLSNQSLLPNALLWESAYSGSLWLSHCKELLGKWTDGVTATFLPHNVLFDLSTRGFQE